MSVRPETLHNELDSAAFDFGNDKRIGFTKDIVEEGLFNKHNRAVFFEAIGGLREIGESVEKDGMKVSLFNVRPSLQHQLRYYYKIDVGEQSFFVKKLQASDAPFHGGGYEEFDATRDATALMAERKDVKVVDYKIGYSDPHKTLYVSRWNSHLESTLDIYLGKLDQRLRDHPNLENLFEKKQQLLERAEEIFSILRKNNFFDVRLYNIAYDENTGTFYLFDLNKKPKKDEDEILPPEKI